MSIEDKSEFDSSRREKVNNALIGWCVLLLAISGYSVNLLLLQFDYQFLKVGSFPPSLEWSPGSNLIRIAEIISFCLFGAAAFSGTMSGFKIDTKSKYFSLFQIAMVAFLIQLVLLSFNIPVKIFCGIVIISLLSLKTGELLKVAIENKNDQIENNNSSVNSMMSNLQLIKSDEIDRRTLAGDLHDQVLHGLKTVRQEFQDYREDATDKLASSIDDGIKKTMDEIREVMDNLSPNVLENLGFAEAIEELVRKGASKSAYRVRYRCDVEGADFEKYSQIELTLLYRIVQESVNNIHKHSQASKVRVLISKREGKLHIIIADNGIGFDTKNMDTDSRGVQYMIQRASIIQAHVNWRPAEKGTGTVVDISI